MIEPVFSFSSANTFFAAQLDLIRPLQSKSIFQSAQQFEQAAVSLFQPLLCHNIGINNGLPSSTKKICNRAFSTTDTTSEAYNISHDVPLLLDLRGGMFCIPLL